MSQSVSSEAVFARNKMAAFYGPPNEDRLPEISVGVEESNQALDLNVVQLAGEMRNGIVPANQPVGDDVEPGFDMLRDHLAGNFILHVEKIGGGSVAAVERGNRSPQGLQFRGIADARVAPCAGKVEARSRAHLETSLQKLKKRFGSKFAIRTLRRRVFSASCSRNGSKLRAAEQYPWRDCSPPSSAPLRTASLCRIFSSYYKLQM